jgi:phospholipid/cholesterol/gamma-HCH transport system substrate-binding protein
MSKKVNTTSIGLFIVTGVALGVAGLLLFSSFKLFSPTQDQIVYFDNSLSGLNEGAPVKYRGVTIGSVKRVMIRFNQAPNDFSLPVIIELEAELLRERLGDEGKHEFTQASMERDVRRGLRATLQTDSLLTGVLYIGLDFQPDALPPVFHQLEKVYVEVPSKPTQTQQLITNLASLDIKSIEKNLNGLLVSLNTSVSDLQLGEVRADLTNVLRSADRMLSSPEIKSDLVAMRTTLDQYRVLAQKLNGRIDPLADSVTHTLAEADRALAQARGAAENLRIQLGPDAPLPSNLDQTLRQLSEAVQSLSTLLELLEQHPNALISGRQNPEKEP